MKIAILSSRFPYPLEKGDKLRLFHQIKHLSKDFDIHLFSLTDRKIPEEDINQLNQYCQSVYSYILPAWKSKLQVLSSFFNKRPFQINYFFNKSIKYKIEQDINAVDPDLIFCQLIRMAEYVKGVRKPKCLDYMDAFSLSMNRRMKKSQGMMKYLVAKETRRLLQYEIACSHCFDGHTAISSEDACYLQKQIGKEVKLISNGVDLEYFRPNDLEKEYDIVFVGNMGYHPNIIAAEYLVKRILPKLKTKPVRLLIAGARPGNRIRKLASDQIHVSGWVEDIRKSYWKAKLFVAPIETGAGQQNKILEAMVCGVPCITTGIVNQGIQAKEGQEIILAEGPFEFAKHIDHLLNEPASRAEIASKALTFVDENYHWEKPAQELGRYLNKIIRIKSKGN